MRNGGVKFVYNAKITGLMNAVVDLGPSFCLGIIKFPDDVVIILELF